MTTVFKWSNTLVYEYILFYYIHHNHNKINVPNTVYHNNHSQIFVDNPKRYIFELVQHSNRDNNNMILQYITWFIIKSVGVRGVAVVIISIAVVVVVLWFCLFFNWRNSIRRCLVWFNKSDNFNSILYIDNKLMFSLSADIINLDNNTHIRIDRRRHYHHHHHHRYFPFYYLTFV